MFDKLCFYNIPSRNISDKFTINRDLCRYLQPGLISSMAYCQPWKIYKLITGLSPSDWKHLLGIEPSIKSLLKIFYFNNKGIRKVKYFKKLPNKKINISLQSNSVKYNKSSKFVSWPNFPEGHDIFSPDICSKTFSH